MAPKRGDSRITILLIDDDAINRRAVLARLEVGGFKVLEASTSDEAIRIEVDFPRTIHVLISKQTMPDMSGRDLINKLKELRPEMRVMLMPGCTDSDRLILKDGEYFIENTVRPGAVVGKVNQILQRELREESTELLTGSAEAIA
jgi:two-component system, cell cycle sensor histidine kinase and response regulator CckA